MFSSSEASKNFGMSPIKMGLMAVVFLLSGPAGVSAWAAEAGEVVHLSGTLSAQRPDGAILVLGPKSEVKPGDVLTTQRDSYAQINFSDGSSMTMRPNTQMKLEAYQFVKEKPEADSAFFRLLKGGMRTVTGLVGKRGNQDAYRIGTSTATIGIRGSTGQAFVCDPSCGGVAPGADKLDPGTHLQSQDGTFTLQVGDKIQLVEAGHSGFSDGKNITVRIGDIGGGTIDLRLPQGGGRPPPAGCAK